ncbi:hypothetical protein MES4922_20112 [Mesorhizobium ventifaucium]|uniref:Uncharacterized protein n=1 Tax=Mesorhizobium ventifaucium TaxID=666020 RepID=A0ABM9DQU7_9HYPH|nr:hypothetical protein MES4922_20112 [Mesorhizobium ventifaucium]
MRRKPSLREFRERDASNRAMEAPECSIDLKAPEKLPGFAHGFAFRIEAPTGSPAFQGNVWRNIQKPLPRLLAVPNARCNAKGTNLERFVISHLPAPSPAGAEHAGLDRRRR